MHSLRKAFELVDIILDWFSQIETNTIFFKLILIIIMMIASHNQQAYLLQLFKTLSETVQSLTI